MKKFVVEQTGYVQVEATRRFAVEVPDHITEEQVEERLENAQDRFPEDEGMEWQDDTGQGWSGYEVVIEETEVIDPDAVFCGPMDQIRAIRLEELESDSHR